MVDFKDRAGGGYTAAESQRRSGAMASPCHPTVELRQAPVLVVSGPGRCQRVGRAIYCPYEAWEGKRQVRCWQVSKLIYRRRDWPADLEPKHFLALVGTRGPGYWQGFGFHIAKHVGLWKSLRDDELGYLPPFTDRGQLTPEALAVVKFRDKQRAKGETVREAAGKWQNLRTEQAGELAAAAAGARQKAEDVRRAAQRDGKMAAAGDSEDEVSFV